MYLGQLAEGRSRYEEALDWYREIGEGQHQFSAGLRAAVVLGKLGRVDEGRLVLTALNATTDAEKTQLFQAEAQMLREARDFEGVYAVLDRGLKAMPDSQDLLYDRAMAAEKLGRLDQLERDLRRLIELNPEHAHAYNALGYTLADRTSRLDEAIELLDKALKLAPEDPFILDSMGWAKFKARRLDEAVSYLKRAYAARPDPEIAAHLGEALWVKGDRDEARRVWQGSLKDHPDNDSLRETLGRLQP
jgi:tetratricopeptide (TPR) repeat protein